MTSFRVITAVGLLATLILPSFGPLRPAIAQQEDRQAVLELINRARSQNGVGPVAPSAVLERAAQKRADEMAARDVLDPPRADDTETVAVVAAAGYPAWRSGARIAGELAYATKTGFAPAPAAFLDQDRQRRVLIERRYREIGIASAISSGPGGPVTYWALLFGAEPNVLPIFLNDGAGVTSDPVLAVRLSQEEVVPDGEGATIVGHIVDVRFSQSPQFDGAEWQSWAPLIAFTLEGTPGVWTVYAQLRDGAGRATVSTASIAFDPRNRATAQPVGPGNDVTPLPDPATALAPTAAPTAIELIAPTPTQVIPIAVITLSPGSVVATPNLPGAIAARPAPVATAPRPAPSPTNAPSRPGAPVNNEAGPILGIAAVVQLAILAVIGRRLASKRI
ncbi:MAG: CAP domain-containing protein [Thermoflexales bacterium]